MALAGDLVRRQPGRTQAAIGILIVVGYTATLPLLGNVPARAYPIIPFVVLGGVALLVAVMKYPAVLLGAYASDLLSYPFVFVSAEANPVRGWSLLPVVAIAMYLLTRRRRISLPVDAALLSQVAFTVVLLAGVGYTSGSTSNAADKAWWFLRLNVFLFASTALFAGDARSQRRILAGYTAGAVLWSVGVYLFGSYTYGRLGFEGLGGPIVYGRACGIVATLMAAWLLARPAVSTALVAVPVGLFALLGSVLSGTRGALLAFLVALLAVVLASLWRGRARSQLFPGCFIVVGAVVVTVNLVHKAPAQLATRYADLDQGMSGESAAGRIYLYSVAGRMFSESPILGEGTGAYPSALQYPHNIFLEVGAELGAVGLLALCCLLTVTCTYALRVLHAAEYTHAQKSAMLLLVGGFVFFLVEAQFSCNITMNRLIWFFCGLICAVHATKDGQVAQPQLAAGARKDAGRRGS
jgi:O-antigen ligase